MDRRVFLARQYYVLRWDLSVDVTEADRIARLLNNKINESIMGFVDKHKFPFLRGGRKQDQWKKPKSCCMRKMPWLRSDPKLGT